MGLKLVSKLVSDGTYTNSKSLKFGNVPLPLFRPQLFRSICTLLTDNSFPFS